MTKRGDVGGLTGQTIIVWVAATVFHKHKQYRKKKRGKKKKKNQRHEQVKKNISSLGFSSIPLFISHSTSSVCFFSLSTSGSCGRVFFVIADIADQAVPCNNNPSCGCAAALLHEVASMSGEGGESERERGERG